MTPTFSERKKRQIENALGAIQTKRDTHEVVESTKQMSPNVTQVKEGC